MLLSDNKIYLNSIKNFSKKNLKFLNKKYFSKFFSNNSRDLVEKTRTGLEKVSRPQENAEKEKIDINNGDSIGDKISNELGLFDG